jgi:Carboxymuconolactone decarboxylase family
VADTRRGVRVFDMRFILDLARGPNGTPWTRTGSGATGAPACGFGYRHAMPQVDAWANAAGPDKDDPGFSHPPPVRRVSRSSRSISSLVTQGTERELELHVNTGLTSGLTKTEIVEAITHLIPYTGFPRVLNALYVAKQVFAQRDAGHTAAITNREL